MKLSPLLSITLVFVALIFACGFAKGKVVGDFQVNGLSHTPSACRIGSDGVELRFDVYTDPEPTVDWILLEPDGVVRVCGVPARPLEGQCFDVGPPGCYQRVADRVTIKCKGQNESGRAVEIIGDLTWEGCAEGPRL